MYSPVEGKVMGHHDQIELRINDPIFQGDGWSASETRGVISCFVTPRGMHSHADRFALAVRHGLVSSIPEAKTNGIDGPVEFGVIDERVVRNKIEEARRRDLASSLRDVSLIRLFESVDCANTLQGEPIRTFKSAAEHFIDGNSIVSVAGHDVGHVSSLFRSVALKPDNMDAFDIEVFGVAPEDAEINLAHIPVGSLAVADGDTAIGVYVGFDSDNELLFLDLKDIARTLDMDLVTNGAFTESALACA